jgi:hypothetical protein
MYELPIQAPRRWLELADCSQLVSRQRGVPDEVLSATGLNSFFQPAQNRIGAFIAPSPRATRSPARPMTPPTARRLTHNQKFYSTSAKARGVGSNVWEWTSYCVEVGHCECRRMLSAVANAVLSGIVACGPRKRGDKITIGTNRRRLISLTQPHLNVTLVGLPRTIGTQETIAVTHELDKWMLARALDTREGEYQAGAAGN